MQGARTTISCQGCKRRKKGCDLKKPCGRCRRLNTECIFEAREYTFVNLSQGHHSVQQYKTDPFSQSSLCSTNSKLQVVSGFWDIFLPRDAEVDMFAPWTITARSLAVQDNLLQQSMEALAFTGLGWWHKDHSLVQYGIKMYGVALRRVNEALACDKALSDVVLSCCRLFSLFEMMPRQGLSNTQFLDWKGHAEGTWQLIKLRGKEIHVQGDGLALFDGVRITAVNRGIASRRANVFTKLEWYLCSNPPTLREELMNLGQTIPELLEEADIIMTSDTKQASDLLARFVAISYRLQSWEAAALRKFEDVKRKDGEKSHDLLLRLSMQRDGFFQVCAQYCAMCICVYHTARRLSAAELESLPPWMDPEPYASTMSRVSSHFFRSDAGLWGAQGAILPLILTIDYLVAMKRQESCEFKRIFGSMMESKSGCIMLNFLQSAMETVTK